MKSVYVLGLFCTSFAFVGCQAPLRLDKHVAQSKIPVQRYDAFQAAIVQGPNVIIAGNDGVVLEMSLEDREQIDRKILRDESTRDLPSFISATKCPDGKVYLLAFDGGLWSKPENGDWKTGRVETSESVLDLVCTDQGDLWVSASFSTLLQSKDGGENWNETSQDEDLIYTQLAFPDGQTGYAFGEFGIISKTEDAGLTWQQIEGPNPEYYPLSAYFANASEGWTAGLGGSIFYTDDGGLSWTRESNESKAPLYRITEVGSNIFAIGNYGTFLSRRPDGTWRAVVSGGPKTTGYLRAITGSKNSSANTLFLGGQGYAGRVEISDLQLDEAG